MKRVFNDILNWVIWCVIIIGGSAIFTFSEMWTISLSTPFSENVPLINEIAELIAFIVPHSIFGIIFLYIVVISFVPMYKIAAAITTMVLIVLLRVLYIIPAYFSLWEKLDQDVPRYYYVVTLSGLVGFVVGSLLIIVFYVLLSKLRDTIKQDEERNSETTIKRMLKKVWSWAWWLIVIISFGVFNVTVLFTTINDFHSNIKFPIFDTITMMFVGASIICFFTYLPFVYMVKHHRILAAVLMALLSGALFILLNGSYSDESCAAGSLIIMTLIYGGITMALCLALAVFYIIKRFGWRNDDAIIFKKWW